MPPKKKTTTKEVVEAPEPTPAQTHATTNVPKETPPVQKPQPKPAATKPVEPPKKQVPATQPSQPLAEQKPPAELGQAELSSKPSTIIKLNQPEKKVISLEKQAKSQRELRQLRAFKFGGKQTTITIDDASKLMSERARKFGGNVPLTSQQRRKRQQKFGGGPVDREQQKELRKKRMQKFGIKSKQIPPQVLPEQDLEVLQARRKKFMETPVEVPQPQKRVKEQ